MLQRIHRREEGVYQSLVTDLGLYDPLQTRQPRFQHGRKQGKTDIFCILCRSSLREAYSPLETLKLISRSKAGTYVNDLDIYQNAMNFEAIAKQTDVKNIAEYRQIFEIGAIQLAAKRATEKNVTRLREILKKMEEVPEDSVALSQYDFEFHAYLMKMTHNELLIVMFNSIRNAYKNLTESIFAMGCLPTTINEHLAIVDAIADYDSALAAHMMQLHLSNIESFRNRQSAAAGKASEK